MYKQPKNIQCDMIELLYYSDLIVAVICDFYFDLFWKYIPGVNEDTCSAKLHIWLSTNLHYNAYSGESALSGC